MLYISTSGDLLFLFHNINKHTFRPFRIWKTWQNKMYDVWKEINEQMKGRCMVIMYKKNFYNSNNRKYGGNVAYQILSKISAI